MVCEFRRFLLIETLALVEFIVPACVKIVFVAELATNAVLVFQPVMKFHHYRRINV